MSEVTLPNGDHVVFKDPADLTERARRTIKKAVTALAPETIAALADAADNGREITASMFTAADLAVADDLNDASAVALIDTWDRAGVAVVPSADALLDLPSTSYDALIKAANPLIAQLSVDASEPSPDPASPTPPASV